MEDIIQDKRHFKQTKIGWVKPSLAQLKETKGKGEDPGAAGKEGKDAKNDELPIPKHRSPEKEVKSAPAKAKKDWRIEVRKRLTGKLRGYGTHALVESLSLHLRVAAGYSCHDRPISLKLLREALARSHQPTLVKKTINKRTGEAQVTGQKGGLAKSANYPLQFGLAVAGLEIEVADSDPNEFDHGAIDDLIKGRKHAAWRFL
ncbi:unnamed protein product [Cladocopium goreaui]|uniref:Uncharacterized protein n=1 Tax=Cladocopium goreaui TaxID=2562237 RepID=A0A9P1GT49_9DINO|nr:unnamed protein product [Cladocopium goreaui]